MSKAEMPTPIGPIPQWLWHWTGEYTECSCCSERTSRADEDGLSLCCGAAITLQVDDVWRMIRDLARTQIRREVVEELGGMLMAHYNEIARSSGYGDRMAHGVHRAFDRIYEWLAEQEAKEVSGDDA